jgi:hypothetical protein
MPQKLKENLCRLTYWFIEKFVGTYLGKKTLAKTSKKIKLSRNLYPEQ